MVSIYFQLFGTKPCTRYLLLLEKGNHLEVDDLEFLGDDDTQKYQSLVRAMQWAISVGQFDICTVVMMLSSFHAQP